MKLIIDTENLEERLSQEPELSAQDAYFLELAKSLTTGEEWKNGNQKKETLPKPIKIITSNIVMPFPFKRYNLHMKRTGDIYSAEAKIRLPCDSSTTLNKIECINQISSIIERTYGDQLVKTSNESAFIINSQKAIIYFGINPEEVLDYKICMGENGTQERKFDPEYFQGDMKQFETVMNHVINAGIDTAVEKGYLESNPDIELEVR